MSAPAVALQGSISASAQPAPRWGERWAAAAAGNVAAQALAAGPSAEVGRTLGPVDGAEEAEDGPAAQVEATEAMQVAETAMEAVDSALAQATAAAAAAKQALAVAQSPRKAADAWTEELEEDEEEEDKLAESDVGTGS